MLLKTISNSLPETSNPVVVVLSGGLDSTILTHLLVDVYDSYCVRALSFNYNQKQIKELDNAKATCKRLNIKHTIINIGSALGDVVANKSANIANSKIKMPTIKEVLGDPQPKTYVPFRNMILNSLAFAYAESCDANYIFSGLQTHDAYGYWDTTESFVKGMNRVAMQNRTHKVEMLCPFIDMSKMDEIKLGIELQKDYPHIFKTTLTCYNPDKQGKSCGVCPSCAERIMNFAKAGIEDPIKYQKDIDWEDLIKKYGK